MKTIQIIDDVVDKATQDLIEKFVLYTPTPKWIYSFGYDAPKRLPLLSVGSFRTFYFDIVKANNHRLVDQSYEIFLAPIMQFNVKKIFKVRCVLQPALASSIDLECQPPHLDSLPEQYNTDRFNVAVYYVNESDGPTVFYKDSYEEAKSKNFQNLEIETKVYPKKGRLILFDHDKLHSSGAAKLDHRSVINYNFYV